MGTIDAEMYSPSYKGQSIIKKGLGLLFKPTNAQTYILKYFISTPTCFSASVQSSGVLICAC